MTEGTPVVSLSQRPKDGDTSTLKLPMQKAKRLLTLRIARPHSAARAGWGPGSLGPPSPLHTALSRCPSRLAAARAYSDLQRKMRVEGLKCERRGREANQEGEGVTT